MTVVKRAYNKRAKDEDKYLPPVINEESGLPVTPTNHEIIQPTIQETKEPAKVEPVIRILEAKRATPQLSQPNTQRIASGNVMVCDRKSGKCMSMAASYAAGYVKRNSKTAYIKK